MVDGRTVGADRLKMTKIVGFVWCSQHGTIHDDGDLSPYGDEHDRCEAINHRPVFMRTRPSEGLFT